MKLTDEQVAEINGRGWGCSVISTGVTPDAAEDKGLPTNAYLLELKKDNEVWFDIVMGGATDIFDTYFDIFGHCMQKMSYTKGARAPGQYTNPLSAIPPKKKIKKK